MLFHSFVLAEIIERNEDIWKHESVRTLCVRFLHMYLKDFLFVSPQEVIVRLTEYPVYFISVLHYIFPSKFSIYIWILYYIFYILFYFFWMHFLCHALYFIKY